MPTKHVDKLIEDYLDNQLSSELSQQVKAHIAECPTCAHCLYDAKRVDSALGPVMRTVLGLPSPRPRLQQEVRNALKTKQAVRPFALSWMAPVKVLSNVGTVAVIVLLAAGVFVVLQTQIPNEELSSNTTSAIPNEAEPSLAETFAPTPTPRLDSEPASAPTNLSLSAAVPTSTTVEVSSPSSARSLTPSTPRPLSPLFNITPTSIPVPQIEQQPEIDHPAQTVLELEDTRNDLATILPPAGTIAFALFNPALDRQLYEVHFINPTGSNHRKFSLDGVSEPALNPTGSDGLAFRAWSGPTSPRSLLTGNALDEQFESITNFWEDAQPDWSPLENRIIFASQRESDRRWRLYSVWGDGSLEINLRREGRSPTFAPDGYRFAFESCDNSGKRCGLWRADLENSEYDSAPFLLNPLAKSPDWAPVGEDIAYMANPDDNWDLYLVDSAGRNIRRLTDDPAIDGLPVWSPDGDWLAFVSDRGGSWGIWLLHLSSNRLRHVITFRDGTLAPPPDSMPYAEHGQRNWWDEQLSWGK